MAYLGSWAIDDALTFYANTTKFDTGVATDADSAATYRVYEDETTTPLLTGSMALLDSANTAGFYSEQITLSAANGFEAGKCYAIYIAATVNSVAGATHHTFQVGAKVNVTHAAGTAWGSGAITAGVIAADAIGASELAADAVAEIADAVWDEDATGHQTGGTFGQAIGDPGADTTTIYQSVVTDAAGTNVAADIIALKAETAAILDDTDDIGVAGAGLTALATQTSVNTIDDFLDTEVAAILAAVDTEVAAIKAKTDSLTFTTANQVDAQMLSGATGAITADVIAANAIGASELNADVIGDIWQGTALTEAYAADGAAATPAQLLYMIWSALAQFAISSTTISTKKLDGTTEAMTFTLDSATDPTSRDRAT